MPKLKEGEWSLVASVATEDRWRAAYDWLSSRGVLASTDLLQVAAPDDRDPNNVEYNRLQNLSRTAAADFGARSVARMDLLEEHGRLVEYISAVLADCSPRLVLDISTLPKRYFFLLVKWLLRQPPERLTDILVTYTSAQKYGADWLATRIQPHRHLPTFDDSGRSGPRRFFVGAGFEAYSLPHVLKDEHLDSQIHVLFPFPPGPPGYHRSYEFLRQVQTTVGAKKELNVKHVMAADVSDAFAHFEANTDSGRLPALFAPYGPKPISLAMCLFAVRHSSGVIYTQPTIYNPAYSSGIAKVGSEPAITGYLLRLSGRDLY